MISDNRQRTISKLTLIHFRNTLRKSLPAKVGLHGGHHVAGFDNVRKSPSSKRVGKETGAESMVVTDERVAADWCQWRGSAVSGVMWRVRRPCRRSSCVNRRNADDGCVCASCWRHTARRPATSSCASATSSAASPHTTPSRRPTTGITERCRRTLLHRTPPTAKRCGDCR